LSSILEGAISVALTRESGFGLLARCKAGSVLAWSAALPFSDTDPQFSLRGHVLGTLDSSRSSAALTPRGTP